MKLQIVAAMVAMAVTSVAETEDYVLQNSGVALTSAEWSADGGVTKLATEDVPAGSAFHLPGKTLYATTYEMQGVLNIGSLEDSAYGFTTGVLNRVSGKKATLTATINWYCGRIHNFNGTSYDLRINGKVNVVSSKYHWLGSASASFINMAADLSSDSESPSITLGHQNSSNTATYEDINGSCPNGQWCLTGDNSGYKGSFTLRDSQKNRLLVLGGKYPLGDPETSLANKLTVSGSGRSLIFAVDGEPLQSANRKIYISTATVQYFGAWTDNYDKGTLSYPITAGSTATYGHFVKVGDGTFRYNGAYAARSIAVSNGTFVVGKDATFPSGQKFVVGSGAKLVIEPGALAALKSPDITFVDETATAEYGQLTVPFDGKAATPVEISRPYAWVQPIALSQPFDLPIRNRKRILVATIPNGGCTLADFRDESPKSTEDGLPETSLDLVTDAGSGAQSLYIVAEPVLTELTVPFDGTNATAVVIDEDWPVGTVQPFTLSQPFALPINATNRVAVMKILGGRHPLDDFQDNTPKTVYELPTTWLELGEEDGYQIVYVVVRPALASGGGARWQKAYGDGEKSDVPTWSDELVTHQGADYYYIEGYGSVKADPRTTGGSNGGAYMFPGESFTMDSKEQTRTVSSYSTSVTFADLRTYPGAVFSGGPASGTSKALERSVYGSWFVGGDESTWGTPVQFRTGAHVKTIGLYASLSGSGALRYHSTNNQSNYGELTMRLYGDNSAFTGQLHFYEYDSDASIVVVSVTNALAFGGSPAEFAANAVCVSRDSGVPAAESYRRMTFQPEVSMTVDTPNRGWRFASCGGIIRTPKDVVFTFAPPRLTLQRANSVVFTLRKDGEGALVLGFDELEYVAEKTSYKLDTQLLVAEGSVGQSKPGILAKLPVVFAGGGVCVDAAHPVEGGFAPKSVALEEGTPAVIPVSFVNLPTERQSQHFTVMTVPARSPELTLVAERCRGYVVTLASEADGDGNTVWTADLEPAGAVFYLK